MRPKTTPLSYGLLRGDYKRSDYGKVILPLTVLRRLDGVLAPTKQEVLERYEGLRGKLERMDPVLNRVTGVQFNNVSRLDLRKLLDDPPNAADGLRRYVAGFSQDVRDIFEKFDLDAQISRLDASNLLYLVLGRFAEIDLGPEKVSNIEMGYIYEELVRRFSELSNETAGEHFTLREVVEVDGSGQHLKKSAFYGRFGNGTRALTDPAERERYKGQVWGR